MGFKNARPLPGPPQDARVLRQVALEALEGWNEQYGIELPQVDCLLC